MNILGVPAVLARRRDKPPPPHCLSSMCSLLVQVKANWGRQPPAALSKSKEEQTPNGSLSSILFYFGNGGKGKRGGGEGVNPFPFLYKFLTGDPLITFMGESMADR